MAQLRLKYGSYTHPDSEAAVSINRTGLQNDEGIIWAIQETWQINGRLEGDTQAALTDAIRALESAYSKSVSKVSLQFADTGADTAHVLTLTNAISPIQVIQPPSYPTGLGAEYSTFRNYQIVIQGVNQVGNLLQSGLIDWTETIATTGGYPRDVLVTTLNTAPIRQRVAQATPTIVTQQGSAAAWTGWPIPPSFRLDIFNTAILLGNSVAKTTQAQSVAGAKMTVYRTAWQYTFAVPILLRLPGTLRPASVPTSLT